tara:strand:- start:4877 stop:5626 length:750 start_codon:yes stop_codon:yes gene_type:complete
MPRERRCSSDGLKLFNMAMMSTPPRSRIKQMLSCLFHSDYDDRLEEMVHQCREASHQLYSYTKFKDINTNKLIDNSIFNVIHAILMRDERLGTLFQIRQNYNYFMDVAEKASEEMDHNSAMMIRCALMHHAIAQLKLKPRKKDKEIYERFEKLYGTFRDCYKNHLLHCMQNADYQFYIPSLMVLNMHHDRHRAFSTIGRCKLRYEPYEIEAQIGMFAMQLGHPGEKMPLYEQPLVGSSTDLILLAQHAK